MEEMQERVESLAKQGVFGKGTLLNVSDNPDVKKGAQFASELKFLVVELEESSKTFRTRIVVKVQPKGPFERAMQGSDYQFATEVAMYDKILPFLGAYDEMEIFPKMFYGESTDGKDPEKDIVIMEDLSPQGFTTAKNVYLDYQHVALTLKKLGEFHGLSYRIKKTQQNEIVELGGLLKARPLDDAFYNALFLPVYERGFKAVEERTSNLQNLRNVFEKIKEQSPSGIWRALKKPEEPYATIVHGDFNKNNLLYKYDDQGKLENVKFLDFQLSLYSDPTVDIAFFLYMNTTQETRDEHWNEFLQIYWQGVTSVAADPGFTFEEFMQNFSKKAIYGYLPCSFFLPMMLDDDKVPVEEFLQMDFEAQVKRMTTTAGDVGTKAVGDIVQDLMDRGYLNEYLNN